VAWRVIVRVSLEEDESSGVRNDVIEPIFTNAGFENISTGHWRNDAAHEVSAAQAVGGVLEGIARSGVDIDQFWLYVERVEDED